MLIHLSFSRFFSNVQESPWYQEFLLPVVQRVTRSSEILDVGTGTGKLLQLLITEKSAVCTGLDIDSSMLSEARRKLKGLPATLTQIRPGADFPFQESKFDYVSVCNVLFNMDHQTRNDLLQQCMRVLKPKGTLIILSPTGKGSLKSFTLKICRRGNSSFGLWYLTTRNSAGSWNRNNYLKEFCNHWNLSLNRKVVFDGFGLLEIIERI